MPGREQVLDLGAHDVGEREGDVALAGVEVVLRLLGHRERPRDRHLGQVLRVGPQELGVAQQDRLRARDRADDPRDRERLAVAVQRLAGVVDVDAAERRRHAVGVALAPDLAVGDDVQPGALLVADRGQGRRVLGLLEEALLDPPEVGGADPRGLAPPQLVSVEQPLGLRVGPNEACQHSLDPSHAPLGVRGRQRVGQRLAVRARAQRLVGGDRLREVDRDRVVADRAVVGQQRQRRRAERRERRRRRAGVGRLDLQRARPARTRR